MLSRSCSRFAFRLDAFLFLVIDIRGRSLAGENRVFYDMGFLVALKIDDWT